MRIKARKSRMKKIYLVGLFCILSMIGMTGCSVDKEQTKEVMLTEQEEAMEQSQKEIFAMDTYMTVTAYGKEAEEAAEAAIEEIERLDLLLSTGDDDSEISSLNQKGEGTVSEDVVKLLKEAATLHRSTEGAFDISIYPMMEIWGFPTGNYQIPTKKELQELLLKVDGSKVNWDEKSKRVSFGIEGMKIDLGGIAKGYTSSRIMDLWEEYGITSGMVNLGGNVQVLGSKVDGSAWKVGIQNPTDETSYLGVLSIQNKAVITSGGYERYFEEDGKTYHHILDPATGYPAENGLMSVTIVSENGTLADGLSTALFVMGREKALEYWQEHSDEFDVILLQEDEKIYATEGIEDAFTSDYQVEIVKKK